LPAVEVGGVLGVAAHQFLGTVGVAFGDGVDEGGVLVPDVLAAGSDDG
jgi:hypothetical protein